MSNIPNDVILLDILENISGVFYATLLEYWY